MGSAFPYILAPVNFVSVYLSLTALPSNLKICVAYPKIKAVVLALMLVSVFEDSPEDLVGYV